MGTCGQPGYVFRDFCLKQGIEFIIFCLNQGIDLSIFVLNRMLLLDDKQQNFYKRLLINIRVKCLKQGIKKSEFCLKQGRKISDICLKQGQGMRGRAAPPYRGIYRVPPPPGIKYPTRANGIIVLVNSRTGFCRRFLFPQFYKAKISKLGALFSI